MCGCGGHDLSRVRGVYLPPGVEKGWPANSGWRQENTEIADTERAMANVFVGSGTRSAQEWEGPTAPHSGCLWGGVQTPNEPAGSSPLTTTRRQQKYLRMSRGDAGWRYGKKVRQTGCEKVLRHIWRGTLPCLVTEAHPAHRIGGDAANIQPFRGPLPTSKSLKHLLGPAGRPGRRRI